MGPCFIVWSNFRIFNVVNNFIVQEHNPEPIKTNEVKELCVLGMNMFMWLYVHVLVNAHMYEALGRPEVTVGYLS